MSWNVPNIFSPGTKILSALVDQNFQYIMDILNNSIISLNSPAFTGSPTAPTGTVDDASPRIATQEFVINQCSNSDPLAISDDIAHIGSATRTARSDHQHPNYIKTQPATANDNTIASTAFVNIRLASFISDTLPGIITAQSQFANYNEDDTGYAVRSIKIRLQDIKTLKDFGAVGDGITDDTTAIGFFLSNNRKYVPEGIYNSTYTISSLLGAFSGYGQIKTSDGNLIAPDFTNINSAPVEGNPDSISTAFNGNINFCRPSGHFVQGSLTLGQPVTGYKFIPESSGRYNVLYVDSTSGHNESSNTNEGRTGVAFNYMNVKHYGNGDAYANYAAVFVAGTHAGATDPLASPAGVVLGGQVQIGAHNNYANNIEQNAIDGGFRATASPFVVNLYRTNPDASMDGSGSPAVHYWVGFNAQSQGTVNADVAFRASGLFKYGFTTTETIFDVNKAAIAIKTSDRIYLGASSRTTGTAKIAGDPGTCYIEDSIYGFINYVYNNTTVFQMNDTQITAIKPLVVTLDGTFVPTANSQLAFKLTSNTNLELNVRGSDGVVRSANITLS